ncbi:hypothetical protein [Elizabethkingia miricola]|uniref:hypothetical protein n=1 Tax=Elizabethkingia miricola TaxID=172045 RepID=UPI00074166A9|nr:hypothetical protein [Elizabethkingia miricola]KUG13003.1 hypothetical protein AMC91_04745 [Elizabethkingia miricola]
MRYFKKILEAIRLESCIRKLALFILPQENKQIAHVLGVGSLIRGKGYASTSDTVSRVPRRFIFYAVRYLYNSLSCFYKTQYQIKTDTMAAQPLQLYSFHGTQFSFILIFGLYGQEALYERLPRLPPMRSLNQTKTIEK